MKTDLERLFKAIEIDDRTIIESYIVSLPKLIEEPDEQGVVPAFIAAREGHYELLKYLMEYTRVSMNVYDHENQSILHYSAMSDCVDCFSYLVERIGMDPYMVNRQLQSPLDIAHIHQSYHIINYYDQVLGIRLDNTYHNPIVKGTYPDPSIIRVEEDYYMVHSSFFLFPCIPILHSKDLVHWETIGHGITDTSYIDLTHVENGRGFWAPDISYSKGRFYITATLRLNDNDPLIRRQMIVSSEKPEGPYGPPVYIDVDGIDPSLFTDDDGRRYMLLNRGARIFEISHEGDAILSEPMMLWYGANKRAPEAPHLLKKDDYYYCFVSEGGTGIGHQISVARSKTILGPYESCPFNPILKQNLASHPIQRSGHGKLVQTQNGEWYIVYLCGRMVDGKYSILGRETSLDQVTWTSDGWPMVNQLKGPSGIAKRPNLSEHIFQNRDTEGFEGEDLDFDWVFVRTKSPEYYQINSRTKSLCMTAGKDDLDTLKARNVLLKRQKAFCFEAQVEVGFQTNIMNIEAGMTCYYDTDTYLKYYVTKNHLGYTLNVLEKIGPTTLNTFSTSIDFIGEITLKIVTEYLERTFYYKVGYEDWSCLGTAKNVYYLCDEGISLAKRFTGAMIGLYTLDPSGSDTVVVSYKDFQMRGN